MRIFNGYSFFTWSAGYDAYGREAVVKEIFHAENKKEICKLLMINDITYVELNKNPEGFIKPVNPIWETFPSIYKDEETGVHLYEVSKICAY